MNTDTTARPDVLMTPSPDALPRLNVVLPNYFAGYAFGGIVSAMELAREVGRHYDAVRFVSEAPLGLPEEMFPFADYLAAPSRQRLETASLQSGPLPCHQRDVFLCTLWTTTRLHEAHCRTMAASGQKPLPFYYFIQDYEPGFFPFGSNHCAALRSYSRPELTHAVFNSLELASFFRAQGLRFAREYAVRPALNPGLRAHLDARQWMIPPKDGERTVILAYGRPGSPRNCFESVVEGLSLFFASLPEGERASITALSAGRQHDPVTLAPGAVLQSLGKLDIPAYAALLEQTHLGLSLMASPHPSYPPLEMALFGAYTITNGFAGKDLSGCHPGLVSLPWPEPELIAGALRDGLAYWRAEPRTAQKAEPPSVLSTKPWRAELKAARIERIG